MSTGNLLPQYDARHKQKAARLVAGLSLPEKVLQMVHAAAENTRAGIPAYNWWNEALHGVARAGVATVFPQAIALAASFDQDLVQEVAGVIATEGRAKHQAALRHGDRDIYKGLTYWSPNINIFRDPLWGRGHETYGEDPYLTSRIGVAFVQGLQGDDPCYLKAAACAKHFAVHSGPEKDRHGFDAQVSPKDLHETYLYAFKALVEEARVEAVMGAYNRINGVPACCNKYLLQDILREDWQFDGHVTSDCWAIIDIVEGHDYAKTIQEAVALAVQAGCDLNCGNAYLHLLAAVRQGLIQEEELDRSLIRLFTARFRLGLLGDDFKDHPYANVPYDCLDSAEHREINLKAALHSIVLLENNGILPLAREKIRDIAVIGPNAASTAALLGNYSGTPGQAWPVLAGIRQEVAADTRVRYAQGCHLYLDSASGLEQEGHLLAEALETALHSDVVILCLGLDASLEGEQGDTGNAWSSGDKPGLELPQPQQKLLDSLADCGKPVILVLLSGSALIPYPVGKNPPAAVLQAFYPGAMGGLALARIIFGDFSPCGCLPVTFYKSTTDLPPMADYAMQERTYRYFTKEPLYRFGHGLSYTSFAHNGLDVRRLADGADKVSTIISNTGKTASHRILQLYLKTPGFDRNQPQEQLRGICKIFLAARESRQISFIVPAEERLLFAEDGSRSIVPDKVEYQLLGAQRQEGGQTPC